MTYSIYIIRKKDIRDTNTYVGMTQNFRGRKCAHKSSSKSLKPTGNIDKYIKENGGWDNFIMYEIETGIENKIQAQEIEDDYRRLYECTLNKNRSGNVTEDISEYQRNWHATNPNYMDEWRQKNPDYMREYNALWKQENPHYHRDYQRRRARIERDRHNFLQEFFRLSEIEL